MFFILELFLLLELKWMHARGDLTKLLFSSHSQEFIMVTVQRFVDLIMVICLFVLKQ